MKAIESSPINVGIAIVYCFFGLLSFFVLKIAAKYLGQRENINKAGKIKSQLEAKRIPRKYLHSVNFSKVFFKTYFMKNTLIGSFFNQDKKYLLKEIFVLSCIAVSCFNINAYILWPWAVGLGVSIVTFLISQLVIPLLTKTNEDIPLTERSQIISNLNDGSVAGSIQIQINTRIELVVSGQREETISKRTEQKSQNKNDQKSPSLELLFIMVLAFVSEMLICACIVKLSLSVSNSGVLNLISFGIAVLIDQAGARVGLGIISYVVCFSLQKTQTPNLLQNPIFYHYCSQAIAQDLLKVHAQAQVEAQNNKIANDQSNLPERNLSDTGAKMINENCFEYHEERVEDGEMVNEVFQRDHQAVIEEPDQEEEVEVKAEIQIEAEISQEKPSQPEPLKDDTNYFELFSHDIQTFTEQPPSTNRSTQKPKKIKKRVLKPQEKLKSDPLLYLPFEEHKLSSHQNSVKQDLRSFEDEISLFQREKPSGEDNLLKNIEVLECVEDSIVTEEEAQIGTILNEKNLNIKTLTINEKAQIPPTSRPNYSATKRSFSKDSIAVKKVKKVSPYLVDLQSQAIKPPKSNKPRKLSRVNKQNANQTNQSYVPESIDISRVTTQKQFRTLDFLNEPKQHAARR